MPLKSNVEWKAWGRQDPYEGVLADELRAKHGPNPWNAKDFYAHGKYTWQICVSEWKKYGVSFKSCLEIGCGPGRITKELASYFTSVHALDISEDMINLAQKNFIAPNLIFHIGEGTNIPLPDASIDSVFSMHVFQHLDKLADGYAYFNEISRVLAEHGTIMIHIPIYIWPCGGSFRRPYKVVKYLERLKIKWKRFLIKKGGAVSLMTMNSYPIDYFFKELPHIGFEDIKIVHLSFRRLNLSLLS